MASDSPGVRTNQYILDGGTDLDHQIAGIAASNAVSSAGAIAVVNAASASVTLAPHNFGALDSSSLEAGPWYRRSIPPSYSIPLEPNIVVIDPSQQLQDLQQSDQQPGPVQLPPNVTELSHPQQLPQQLPQLPPETEEELCQDFVVSVLPHHTEQAVEEKSLQCSMAENKESLKRKLAMRRPIDTLVAQGIHPPLKAPAAFYKQSKDLERAKINDLLKHKIQNRPARKDLVDHHILEDTKSNLAPILQERQRQLKRARLADGLREKLEMRPGPIELIRAKILQPEAGETLIDAIETGVLQYQGTPGGQQLLHQDEDEESNTSTEDALGLSAASSLFSTETSPSSLSQSNSSSAAMTQSSISSLLTQPSTVITHYISGSASGTGDQKPEISASQEIGNAIIFSDDQRNQYPTLVKPRSTSGEKSSTRVEVAKITVSTSDNVSFATGTVSWSGSTSSFKTQQQSFKAVSKNSGAQQSASFSAASVSSDHFSYQTPGSSTIEGGGGRGSGGDERRGGGKAKSYRSRPHKNSSSKSGQSKPRQIKFHEYMGPNEKLHSTSQVAVTDVSSDPTTYQLLLKQQTQLLKLELQNRNLQAMMPPPPPPGSNVGSMDIEEVGGRQESLPSPDTPSAVPKKRTTPPSSMSIPGRLEDFTVTHLKAELRARGMVTSGKKEHLVERLRPLSGILPSLQQRVAEALQSKNSPSGNSLPSEANAVVAANSPASSPPVCSPSQSWQGSLFSHPDSNLSSSGRSSEAASSKGQPFDMFDAILSSVDSNSPSGLNATEAMTDSPPANFPTDDEVADSADPMDINHISPSFIPIDSTSSIEGDVTLVAPPQTVPVPPPPPPPPPLPKRRARKHPGSSKSHLAAIDSKCILPSHLLEDSKPMDTESFASVDSRNLPVLQHVVIPNPHAGVSVASILANPVAASSHSSVANTFKFSSSTPIFPTSSAGTFVPQMAASRTRIPTEMTVFSPPPPPPLPPNHPPIRRPRGATIRPTFSQPNPQVGLRFVSPPPPPQPMPFCIANGSTLVQIPSQVANIPPTQSVLTLVPNQPAPQPNSSTSRSIDSSQLRLTNVNDDNQQLLGILKQFLSRNRVAADVENIQNEECKKQIEILLNLQHMLLQRQNGSPEGLPLLQQQLLSQVQQQLATKQAAPQRGRRAETEVVKLEQQVNEEEKMIQAYEQKLTELMSALADKKSKLQQCKLVKQEQSRSFSGNQAPVYMPADGSLQFKQRAQINKFQDSQPFPILNGSNFLQNGNVTQLQQPILQHQPQQQPAVSSLQFLPSQPFSFGVGSTLTTAAGSSCHQRSHSFPIGVVANPIANSSAAVTQPVSRHSFVAADSRAQDALPLSSETTTMATEMSKRSSTKKPPHIPDKNVEDLLNVLIGSGELPKEAADVPTTPLSATASNFGDPFAYSSVGLPFAGSNNSKLFADQTPKGKGIGKSSSRAVPVTSLNPSLFPLSVSTLSEAPSVAETIVGALTPNSRATVDAAGRELLSQPLCIAPSSGRDAATEHSLEDLLKIEWNADFLENLEASTSRLSTPSPGAGRGAASSVVVESSTPLRQAAREISTAPVAPLSVGASIATKPPSSADPSMLIDIVDWLDSAPVFPPISAPSALAPALAPSTVLGAAGHSHCPSEAPPSANSSRDPLLAQPEESLELFDFGSSLNFDKLD